MSVQRSRRLAENPEDYVAGPESDGPSRPAKKPPIPESALWRLWQRRAALQEWFRTNQGQRVRVLYPGRPGHTAGPDFRNALLHFEELGLVQGDVEIHRRQQDWNAHGHQDDPNYNGVVLHAALDPGDSPPRPANLHSGGQAPVVSLSPLLADDDGGGNPAGAGNDAELLWDVLAPLGYPRPETPEQWADALDRAGDARFHAKSARFGIFLEEEEPEQVIYEGLFEALGYRQNQRPFVALAGRAPYAALASAARRCPPEDRAGVIESWLLRLSGLDAGGAAIAALPRHGFGKPLSSEEWHFFRVRPPNHPRRRIAGAARLLARTLDQGLLPAMTGATQSGKPSELTAALTVTEGKETYIGPGRAREIAVNVVLPFCHALASKTGQIANAGPSSEADKLLAQYHRFGKLPDNEIARELSALLFDPGQGRVKMNARRQQGLIHLQRLLSGASS